MKSHSATYRANGEASFNLVTLGANSRSIPKELVVTNYFSIELLLAPHRQRAGISGSILGVGASEDVGRPSMPVEASCWTLLSTSYALKYNNSHTGIDEAISAAVSFSECAHGKEELSRPEVCRSTSL